MVVVTRRAKLAFWGLLLACLAAVWVGPRTDPKPVRIGEAYTLKIGDAMKVTR